MVKLQHVSFKDWNPVGKPRKKSKGKNGDLLGSVKNRTYQVNNSPTRKNIAT